ncbi:Uncharacterised protein [Mycobacteroides abscessus subsp. abscessus]|nr:Uncharacterised protein [Mycobacteroides abscessus subsp. abscessus]
MRSGRSEGSHAYARHAPTVGDHPALVTYPTTFPSTVTGSFPSTTAAGSSNLIVRRRDVHFRWSRAFFPTKSCFDDFTAKLSPAAAGVCSVVMSVPADR